ncbi:MAG: LysR family transcriptional regulator [Pseudomonadales bacterium]
MRTDIDVSKFRRLDGNLLLVFRELLQQCNVTRVAGTLHLSQSAVSHSLGRLRELFDDPLFVRKPHGLEPTQRALELGPQIEALISLSAETLGIGGQFEPESTKRVFRLSAPEFVSVAIGPALSRNLASSAPGAHYWVEHLAPAMAFERLVRGQLDLALGRFDEAPPADLVIEPLFEDSYCVVARKKHPTIREKVSLEAYHAARHVFAESRSELTPRDRDADYSIFLGGTVPRWLAAMITVAQTDDIATCPRLLATSLSRILNLSILEPPFETNPILVSLARRRILNDRGVEWFLGQVKGMLNDVRSMPRRSSV